MRKGWLVVFWFVVGSGILACWLGWWASLGFPAPICPEAGDTGQCLSRDEIRAWAAQISDSAWNIAEFANHWAALIATFFAAALAIATIRLWQSTDKLWSVTNKTLEQSERTSRKKLRAYLSVEPLGIDEYIEDNYLVGHFRIRNVGQLPASNVSVYSTIALDADAARRNFPLGTARISPTVLQPSAKMEFGSYEGYPIPADQLDSSEPLKLRGFLYVWGEVLYTDEFNTVGWTTFCHRYPGNMFGVVPRNQLSDPVHSRSIHRKFASYHQEAGNEAG
jgi:hypothetical protein